MRGVCVPGGAAFSRKGDWTLVKKDGYYGGAYLLSKTQGAWWFFIVLAAYLFIGIITGDFTSSLNSTALILLGIGAGIVVVWGIDLLEYLRIDDPIGAVPVHMMAGIWGNSATSGSSRASCIQSSGSRSRVMRPFAARVARVF